MNTEKEYTVHFRYRPVDWIPVRHGQINVMAESFDKASKEVKDMLVAMHDVEIYRVEEMQDF